MTALPWPCAVVLALLPGPAVAGALLLAAGAPAPPDGQRAALAGSRPPLAELAPRLRTRPALLPRAINAGCGPHFNGFVNTCRGQEAPRKLAAPRFAHHPPVGMALESGLRSKSTLNRACKKLPGPAPGKVARPRSLAGPGYIMAWRAGRGVGVDFCRRLSPTLPPQRDRPPPRPRPAPPQPPQCPQRPRFATRKK